jgi:hypothetical protein
LPLGREAGSVKVGTGEEFFDEDQVLGLALTASHDPSRPEGFAVFDKTSVKVVWWSGKIGLTPFPKLPSERWEVF